MTQASVQVQPSPSNSEDELALALVAAYGICFASSPGMGPMYFDGVKWKKDVAGKMRARAARHLVRGRAQQAADAVHRTRLASLATVRNVAQMSELDDSQMKEDSVWDAQPHELNTPDGILDLRRGVMRAREPNDYVTKVTSVSPDMSAPPQLWLRFLEQVFEGDTELIAFIQRALGYSLTAERTEQKMLFAHGSGANGKTTLFEVVRQIMHDYAAFVPSAILLKSTSTLHPTAFAQMQGLRLALTSELPDDARWSEEQVKNLTGESTIPARYMGKDYFQMRLTHKHVVISNDRPWLNGADYAMARRLVLVPFRARFEGPSLDKDLPTKLLGEAPRILAWLAAGAVEWYARGLDIPRSILKETEEYFAENDDVAKWLEDRCCRAPSRTAATELYADYREWVALEGRALLSQKQFGQRLLALGFNRKKSSGNHYEGVALRPSGGLGG